MGDASLVGGFATFDRAYIPVLAMTSQGKVNLALQLHPRMEARWAELEPRIGAAFGDDAMWAGEAAHIRRAFAESLAALRKGEPKAAHEALEEVRLILAAARGRQGIEYFVDRLTDYHDPMEAVVLATRERTALSAADLAHLRELGRDARQMWEPVAAAVFHPTEFGFDAQRTAQLQAALAQESEALAALEEALAQSDSARALKTGPALKPPFANAFMQFGDFPAQH